MLEIERDSDGVIVAVCEWDIIDGRTLWVRELYGSVKWAMRRLKKLEDKVDAVIWTREYKYPGREYIVADKQKILRRMV
jgi:hypothetical protein